MRQISRRNWQIHIYKATENNFPNQQEFLWGRDSLGALRINILNNIDSILNKL